MQLFGVGWPAGRRYTNAPTEYHDRIRAYGPQIALTKLATSDLFLPLGTTTVERRFSTLNRIACAERTQLSITALGLPNAHFAEDAETLFPDLLESAIEELFKTVRLILQSVLGHTLPKGTA